LLTLDGCLLPEGNKYVVKVHNGIDSFEFISAQTEAMELVRAAGLRAPIPLRCKDGRAYTSIRLPSLHEGKEPILHCLRLFQWIEGKMFSDLPLSTDSLFKVIATPFLLFSF
jgi:Ser/Thr protein kinase RdoA (MazF antagonist)